MRNVTNYFLVNLSMADLMMSCLNTIFNFIFMKNRYNNAHSRDSELRFPKAINHTIKWTPYHIDFSLVIGINV